MKKPNPIGKTVEYVVASLDDHGQGVGIVDDRTMAVHGGLPGDVIRAKITWASQTTPWAKGDLLCIVTPSPMRVENPCPHAPRCVGCPLMALRDDIQLREKGARLRRALDEVGLQELKIDDVTPAPTAKGYRSRAKYVVQGSVLGAYAPGTHDVVATDGCHVVAEPIAHAVAMLKPLLPVGGDALRYVILRCNRAGDVLATLVVRRRGALDDLVKRWTRTVPKLLGVLEHLNDSPGDALLSSADDAERTLHGAAHLTELFSGIPVNVSSTAFTQLHPDAAEGLCEAVASMLTLPGRRVLDAYSGLGAFAFALREAAEVIGVDDSAPAIRAAQHAAERAGLTHLRFELGDAAQRMSTWTGPAPDAVVVDPPRKGLSDVALSALIRMRPSQLVYVACEPKSLARDVKALLAAGWRVQQVRAFDLFPQTPEVESVALLAPG